MRGTSPEVEETGGSVYRVVEVGVLCRSRLVKGSRRTVVEPGSVVTETDLERPWSRDQEDGGGSRVEGVVGLPRVI